MKYRTEAQRREARREAHARWAAKHPNHAHDYYKRNRKNILEQCAQYRNANRARIRKRQYDVMVATRNKRIGIRTRCDLCRKPTRTRSFCSDHDHAIAAKFCRHQPHRKCPKCERGVLCSRCNHGLGLFGDSPRLLEKAGRYIRKWHKILKSQNRKRG
jgi:hypothetical protein